MAQSENSENKERGFWESIFGTIGDIIASLLHDFLFDDPKRKGIIRFSLPTRTFHWITALLVILMGLTGLILFVPGWGTIAVAGWTRIIHRISAYIFATVLIVYGVSFPKASWTYFKESFTWGRSDFAWVKAAVDYYLGGDESKMPPQGHINPGQKIWQLITIVCGVILFITGGIMAFLKGTIPPGVFQWMLFTHALMFIIGTVMLIVHAILGTIHPRMTESLRSMITGKVSEEYAQSHYGRWYEEVAKKQG